MKNEDGRMKRPYSDECARVLYGNSGTVIEKFYCAGCRKEISRKNARYPNCGLSLLWPADDQRADGNFGLDPVAWDPDEYGDED